MEQYYARHVEEINKEHQRHVDEINREADLEQERMITDVQKRHDDSIATLRQQIVMLSNARR